MEIKKVITLVAVITASLGVLVGGAGFLVYSYKRAGRQERKDVTDTADTIADFWKKQAEELKQILQTKDAEFNQKIQDMTKEFNEKIQALTKEVGELTGQLNAEKAQNDRLEKIFQNRNPEMETFMKYMVAASERHDETHKKMIQILTDLHQTSTANHEIWEAEKDKDLKIESTITKK